MKCLITGVAGFIGSSLADKLLELGNQVIGIDCLTDYYSPQIKKNNIEPLLEDKKFVFKKADILSTDLSEYLREIDIIYHLASQPGVRGSWGKNFSIYVKNNIHATQILLEACIDLPIKKFIYASSSSVYGDVSILPVKEDAPLKPISPYGVTKLAGENLAFLYYKAYGIPVVSLRYFTVFGAKQRPDMAFSRFLKAALNDEPIQIFGTGNQTRDFTYIEDAVTGTMLAVEGGRPGQIYNIGGGKRISLNEVLNIIEKVIGKKLKIERIDAQKGDVQHTFADILKAQRDFNYRPQFPLSQGIEKQYAWIKKIKHFN
jgi:nucleoside-diphosphate-sugar epimerase